MPTRQPMEESFDTTQLLRVPTTLRKGDCTAPKANILLVDDSPIKLLALESALAGPKQYLSKARSADEALRYLLHQDFAVIALDGNILGMSGFELAELIRRRERSRHTPLLFISAVSPAETCAFKGYELDTVDYVDTPTPEVLRAKVAVFVDLFNKAALHFCHLGQENLAYEDTDLSVVVQEVLNLLHITLTQQDIKVRTPHPRDDYSGGTGAGLCIAKKIVERHGGTLWAESTYGAGSTFYFTLPGSVTCYGGEGQPGDSPDRRQC
jgi:CheY-like chemotaxis protein